MSTTYNIGTVTIAEYGTGSEGFDITDGMTKVTGTIYWTVKDNKVQWYAKCTQAYLHTFRESGTGTYRFSGNNFEYMKLSVDGTVTSRVMVATQMSMGVSAAYSADHWVADNTYKNATTATIEKSKKSSAFAIKLIVEGNGGNEGSYNISTTADAAYTTIPQVIYWRDGQYVKAYLTGHTYKDKDVPLNDTYIYDAVLTIGNQSSGVRQAVKWRTYPSVENGLDYEYTIGSTSDPMVSYATSANTATATLSISSSDGGAYSATFTFTMNVPAASTLTFSQTGVSLGESLSITINRYDNTFTDTIQYIVGGSATNLTTKTSLLSYTWNPIPLTIAQYAPNSPTVSVTIRCITYSGNTEIGRNDKVCTLTIPDTVGPTITALNISPYNTNSTVAGWGIYLQGYSQFQISVTANMSAAQGATISNYKVTTTVNSESTVVLNSTQSSVTTPIITKYGSYTITAVVTDSRGHTAEASSTRYVYWYANPTATNISCIRTTATGVPSASGTYLTANGTRSFSSANGNNVCTMTLSYKPAGGSYSSPELMTNNTTDRTPLTVGNGGILLSQTYTAKITVTDSLGNTNSYTIDIPTGFATINFKNGGTGVCFGGYSTHDNSVEIVDGWGLITGDGISGSTLPATGVDGQVFFEKTGYAVYPHVYGNNNFGTSKESFNLTYVTNPLITSSEFNYHCYRVGDIIFMGLNFSFTNQSDSGFVTIATLPFSVANIMYQTVPMQNNPAYMVCYYLLGNELRVYKPGTNAGLARTSLIAPL